MKTGWHAYMAQNSSKDRAKMKQEINKHVVYKEPSKAATVVRWTLLVLVIAVIVYFIFIA